MSKDTTDLIFRLLFSFIFIALGTEHMVSDELIQKIMPPWIPEPKTISIFVGSILLTGGIFIVLGYQLRLIAFILGGFVIVVTLTVHLPYLFYAPEFIDDSDKWIWDILQRSNVAKNLCLLGVCILLRNYTPGKWSIDAYLKSNTITER